MESHSRSEAAGPGHDPAKSGRDIGVHVLSESVFCPRAAILALESGQDGGDEEPALGPRLDDFVDYDEHRFVVELDSAWGRCRLWLTLLAPAGLLVLIAWRWHSPFAGAVMTLPAIYLASKLWESFTWIVTLVRERAIFAAVAPVTIDLKPQEPCEVSWWAIRKAGFDCKKPNEPYPGLGVGVTGKPWRVLTKGTTLRIPVIRKHRGERTWGRQHVVRVAAYCRLIESNELADAPFGVLMFAGSYDCVIIPNTTKARFEFENALEDVQELFRVHDWGRIPPPQPRGNQCSKCHLGKPRRYLAGRTDTVLNCSTLVPFLARANNGQLFHSPCGDRFRGDLPPHDCAMELGIAKPKE